jgi:hypothetical protein
MPLTLLPVRCSRPDAKRYVLEEILERVDYKCDPCWQRQREEEQARKFKIEEQDGEGEGDEEDKDEDEMERLRRRRGSV